jgi:Domain of unknown function (DUF6285)
MQPRPDAAELAIAVREFLESEIMPVLTDPRLKFRTLVAMNALGMLEREAELEEGFLHLEFEGLMALLKTELDPPDSLEALREAVCELNTDLSRRIRDGNAPNGTLGVLKRAAMNKLRVSSPGYLKRYSD